MSLESMQTYIRALLAHELLGPEWPALTHAVAAAHVFRVCVLLTSQSFDWRSTEVVWERQLHEDRAAVQELPAFQTDRYMPYMLQIGGSFYMALRKQLLQDCLQRDSLAKRRTRSETWYYMQLPSLEACFLLWLLLFVLEFNFRYSQGMQSRQMENLEDVLVSILGSPST
jgi:hypothetical protein